MATTVLTRAELYALGLRGPSLQNVSTDDQDTAIAAAGDTLRSYFRARYQGDQLEAAMATPAAKRAWAHVATYDLLSTRGFNPDTNEKDANTLRRNDAALRWARDVSNGIAHLAVPETPADTFCAWMEPLSDDERGT